MTSLRGRCAALVLCVSTLSACGPSPVAHDPPPADPGTASLRLGDEIIPISGALICENGVTAERSRSPTSLYCRAESADDVRHHVDILLELGNTAALPEGATLSTLSEVTLVRAGGGSSESSTGADTASWDGAITLTLGPLGTPRTAVLDGALSSVFTPSIAMTFRTVSIALP